MSRTSFLRAFLLPKWSVRFLLRVGVLALLTVLVARFVLIPARIQGDSMTPSYRDGGFTIIRRSDPRSANLQRFDVVGIRFSGTRVMLLKRIVAFAGESVAFRNGHLMINDRELAEPYVVHQGTWNLDRRIVGEGKVYVIGDRRDMPLEQHLFGQVELSRIIGKPLW